MPLFIVRLTSSYPLSGPLTRHSILLFLKTATEVLRGVTQLRKFTGICVGILELWSKRKANVCLELYGVSDVKTVRLGTVKLQTISGFSRYTKPVSECNTLSKW